MRYSNFGRNAGSCPPPRHPSTCSPGNTAKDGRWKHTSRSCAVPTPIRVNRLAPVISLYVPVLRACKLPTLLPRAPSRCRACSAALHKVMSGPAERSCVWRRLGHTSLDSNERSGHGARELKSVRLDDAAAAVLRLQLQRCHINALNAGNQVPSLAVLNE